MATELHDLAIAEARRGDRRRQQPRQRRREARALRTVQAGGRHVDPISIDLLKPFVPETFAGLPRTRSSAEKTGVAALMVSKAEASYGDGAARNVTLEVLDTGGASGLVGLASWAQLHEDRDDDDATERTKKVGGRLMHEKLSKRGGTNEFSVVLG